MPRLTTRQMTVRRDAEPLRPDELIQLRRLLRSKEVEEHLDASEVARRLSLANRTVLDLARAGELGRVWKPSGNRVRIPVSGVDAYIARRASFFSAGADVSTQEDES